MKIFSLLFALSFFTHPAHAQVVDQSNAQLELLVNAFEIDSADRDTLKATVQDFATKKILAGDKAQAVDLLDGVSRSSLINLDQKKVVRALSQALQIERAPNITPTEAAQMGALVATISANSLALEHALKTHPSELSSAQKQKIVMEIVQAKKILKQLSAN